MSSVLIRGRYVVTDPARLPAAGMVEDGFLLIEDGVVAEAAPWRDDAPKADCSLGNQRALVIPGLANCHHHGRGLTAVQLGAPDGPLETWLPEFLGLPPLDVYADTLWANLGLLRSGVTTVLHSAYARRLGALEQETTQALAAYRDAGMRVCYAVGFEDRLQATYGFDEAFAETLPPTLANDFRKIFAPASPADVDAYFDLVQRFADAHAGDPRLRIAFGPTWYLWCSRDFLTRVGSASAKRGMGVHIHALESPLEREALQRVFGGSLAVLLAESGMLNDRLSIAHGTHLSGEEIAEIGAAGASVCVNPSSNLRLSNGAAPFRRLAECVNLCLGMDSWSLGGRENIFEEARLLLALTASGPAPRFGGRLDAFDALRMMTVNAAGPTALDVGRLEVGSPGDAVVVDYDRMVKPYVDPGVHPVEALIGLAAPEHIEWVTVGGDVVLEQGRPCRFDEGALADDLARAAASPSPADEEQTRFFKAVKPYLEAFHRRRDAER